MNTTIRHTIAVALLLSGTFSLAREAESRGFSGGIEVHDKVAAADIGLPAYPGARPQRDSKDDAAGLHFGLWGGSFGFKLVVAKYESSDGVEAVAEFYRKALAAQGPVLDCSRGAPRPPRSAEKKRELRCEDEQPAARARVYKAGTPQRFRLVSIEPGAAGSSGTAGTRFQLVLVESSEP